MKTSILIRLILSALATLLSIGLNRWVQPASGLMSSNAALGQMNHSDSSYLASIAGMNFAEILGSSTSIFLIIVLVLIWGSLLIKHKK